jgi:hypothetical protein
VDQQEAGSGAGPQSRMSLYIGKPIRGVAQGVLTRPAVPDGAELADSPLLANGNVLHGFFSSDASSKGEMVSLGTIDLTRGMVRIRPESVAFGKMEDPVPVVIALAPDGESELPNRGGMYSRELASGEAFEISKSGPPFECISDRSKASGYLHEGAVHGTLRAPLIGQKEVAHLVQVGWSPAKDGWDQAFSQPFIVRLKRDGNSVTASVEGLKNLNEANAGADSRIRSLTLEGLARDMMEIAGGRELLVQLESAPYWKRFSMERKDWLPLPSDQSFGRGSDRRSNQHLRARSRRCRGAEVCPR